MDKLSLLKKIMAGGALATGAALLLTPEEASAAGIETIARKLGIGLEEAAKIKQMAKSVPPDVFEENIKAIQTVSNFKKNPELYKKIGHGVDYRAFETPSGSVLKEPKELTEPSLNDMLSTSILETEDLAPKTKHIEVGDKIYKTQNKLDLVNKRGVTQSEANLLDNIHSELDQIRSSFSFKLPEAQQEQLIKREQELMNQYDKIQSDRLQGISPEDIDVLYSEFNPRYGDVGTNNLNNIEDAKQFPEVLTAAMANQYIGQSEQLHKVLRPIDVHEYNVGIDPNTKAIQIFDTSRFGDVNMKHVTPEMKQKILENYISLPEKRNSLKQTLEPNITEDTIQLPYSKKVAAVAPLAGISNDDETSLDKLSNAYRDIRKPILDATRSIGESVASGLRPSSPAALTSFEQAEEEQNRTPEMEQVQRNVGGFLGQVALDPVNYINPIAGIAAFGADMMTDPEKENRVNAIKRAAGKQ